MENSTFNPNIILMRFAPRRATLYFKWRFPRGEDKEETTRLFFMSTPCRPIPPSQFCSQPPKRFCFAIVGFWPDDYENEWYISNELNMNCRTPPRRFRLVFWAFDPMIMRMNDVLNEHELQETPEEVPLRIWAFDPLMRMNEVTWMSMSCRTPPRRLRLVFWAFDPIIMRMNDMFWMSMNCRTPPRRLRLDLRVLAQWLWGLLCFSSSEEVSQF